MFAYMNGFCCNFLIGINILLFYIKVKKWSLYSNESHIFMFPFKKIIKKFLICGNLLKNFEVGKSSKLYISYHFR